ncbi:MAG: IclR family transcriptional regulator [Acidobacteriota bacterium]|nr:IclR family transcriptional regulator [Acidobacteriota bacterium]
MIGKQQADKRQAPRAIATPLVTSSYLPRSAKSPACTPSLQRLQWSSMPSASAQKTRTVKSSAMSSTLRCFKVLELLAEEPFELSVSDIADLLSTPRASAHRLCATLLEGGFVEHVALNKRYKLSSKSLWVGSGYLRHSAVYRAAFFPMQELAKQIPGTAQLGVYSEDTVLFVHSVGYPGSMHAFADVGLRRALHATASGKLFLADMPLQQVQQLMSRGVEKFTERTTVSFAGMKEELARVTAQGYAVNDEELLPGYLVIAAPVLDAKGTTVAAISVTLPAVHSHPGPGASHVALLCDAALRTSLLLGYSPHSSRRS